MDMYGNYTSTFNIERKSVALQYVKTLASISRRQDSKLTVVVTITNPNGAVSFCRKYLVNKNEEVKGFQ
jgi:ABC-type cobalamin/Fe3+-siderophores transport system ATPase subunit